MKNKRNKSVSLFLVFMFCAFTANYAQNEFVFSTQMTDNSSFSCSYRAVNKDVGKKNESFSEKKEGITGQNGNNYSEDSATSGKTYVYPGGDLIGIKLNTEGVIAVAYEKLPHSGSSFSPAQDAGILAGDVITHIDGLRVNSADEFERLLSVTEQSVFTLTLQRKDVVLEKKVNVVKCEDGVRRIGLWVRDNVTGLGTLSFITSDKSTFAALGHPISDSSTGITVPVRTGELVGAEVMSIVKGRTNHPGEIRGIIRRTAEISGTITKNNDFGIYGTLSHSDILTDPVLMPVGTRSEIREGKALLITTVDNVKSSYEIQIEKIYSQSSPSTRSMMIRIMDNELLEKTGGIIQGMSGSPIIQDGKFIGAVTHVLTADPTRGYAIFAEWMIKNCSSCRTSTAFCMEDVIQ